VEIDVFTLFPRWFEWFLEQRHVRNALAHGHALHAIDLRASTPLSGGQVDDTPYGGGAGMVIRVDVVEAALRDRYGGDPLDLHRTRRVIALAPSGRQFDDALADELAGERALTLLCGRYEGFDERVHEHIATDVVSIGPYVLSGGELAAMVVCDAVLRKLPGALGHAESALEESFSRSLRGAPEYPHYTRPPVWRGHAVPDVLLTGNHANIRSWRLERSAERSGEGARGGRGGDGGALRRP
jgi:tRNA (guanine37-N1)-methyltransferase